MDDPIRPGPAEVTVLLPAYNDWPALALLLRRLDGVLAGAGISADVLVADDGSTQDPPTGPLGGPWEAIGRIEVLPLRRNLGHQRAIAVGLAFLEAERPACELVVVMDSDGEDDPADVPRLIERCEQTGRRAMVFAERAKRSESPLFRACYHAYRLVHRVLTGRSVRVGNFSVVPRRRLASLVVTSELWNHYAAAAFTSRQPVATVATARARRLDGRSKMNFVGLVIHGLSAVSVYGDAIGVRLMIATAAMIGLTLLALAATVVVRLTTSLAIPGWATTAFGVLLIVLLQAILFLVVSSFMVLAGRTAPGFLPKRDYVHFVGPTVEVTRR
jgi:polyisoprenyl-phosphate glycosyltransferase